MRFVRWEGACSGKRCSVQLTGGQMAVTAVFAPPRYALSLSRAGRGRIVLGSSACSAPCTKRVRSYTTLRLQAVPEPGWRFSQWGGACRGKVTPCVLDMSRPAAVRVIFKLARVDGNR
jgi:hypothetical protein